jgi:hypothetical protein
MMIFKLLAAVAIIATAYGAYGLAIWATALAVVPSLLALAALRFTDEEEE